MAEAPQKRCAKCGDTKSLDDFHLDSSVKDRRQARCKVCRGAMASEWWHSHSVEEKAAMGRKRLLPHKFGITEAEYEEILAYQGGVCAICRRPCVTNRNLAVDHDHRCCSGRRSCGKCVRGLLCLLCNQALGALGDDPARVRAAALYLEKSR